ncbi:MAG: bifunctional metallophosphatase/5'-nucleotidase [Neisseriaceae bacterium]|nr:MAG: bifunctional metallophosphatase/5'-nucleotidase [Neisseriaceae bacterium]
MHKINILLISVLLSNLAYAADDITVVALNDFHGQMAANKSMVGAAKISTFLQNFRKQYPNTVVVLAGDNYQGTAISNISLGQVDNEFFNYIGVKYSALGNHDFDYGQAVFESWARTNQFPFLAANVINAGDGSVFKYAKPYGELVLPSGKKVAFIGLATLETPATTGISNIEGLKFTNPVASANQWVKFLNSAANKQGKPDSIILLTHIPSEQESSGKISYEKNSQLKNSEIDALTRDVHGVSAVISAHSHQKVSGFLNNVAVVQGASQGKDVSVLHYDCHTTKICQVTPEIIDLESATKNMTADPQVEKIIAKYYDKNKAVLNQKIAPSSQELSNMPESGSLYNIKLTYTIADIMRKYTNSEIGLQNTYGIRRSLPAGEIDYSMVYEAMPFDNTVTTLKIQGKYLLKLLEHSLPAHKTQFAVFAGVTLQLDSSGKIIKALVNSEELDPKREYTLATINFLSSGGDGFDFSHATDIKDTNIPIREVVRNQWEKQGIEVPADWQSITVK